MALLSYSASLVPGDRENVNDLNTILEDIKQSVNHVADEQIDPGIGWDKMGTVHGAVLIDDEGSSTLRTRQVTSGVSNGAVVNLTVAGGYLCWFSCDVNSTQSAGVAGTVELLDNGVAFASIPFDVLGPFQLGLSDVAIRIGAVGHNLSVAANFTRGFGGSFSGFKLCTLQVS